MQFILHTLFGNLVVRVDVVCDPNCKYRYFANLFPPKDYVVEFPIVDYAHALRNISLEGLKERGTNT